MANTFTFQEQSFATGDTIRLHLNVEEGEKNRTQIFEGILISISGSGTGKSITVRKIGANSIGVERLMPLGNPNLVKIEKKSAGRVRRAKLYYLRDRVGRQASKVKTKIEATPKTTKTKTVKSKSAPKKNAKSAAKPKPPKSSPKGSTGRATRKKTSSK